MGNIIQSLSFEPLILYGFNLLAIIILLIMNLSSRLKLKALRNKYDKFMSGLSDKNIEELLEATIEKVNQVHTKNKEFENKINNIERNVLQCTQKVGIVRFSAFENVGSDLSFSIALLDYNDNGIVLSGIYSRDSSSTYAKPIVNGKSKYTLSAEESQALDLAKKTHREGMYIDR